MQNKEKPETIHSTVPSYRVPMLGTQDDESSCLLDIDTVGAWDEKKQRCDTMEEQLKSARDLTVDAQGVRRLLRGIESSAASIDECMKKRTSIEIIDQNDEAKTPQSQPPQRPSEQTTPSVAGTESIYCETWQDDEGGDDWEGSQDDNILPIGIPWVTSSLTNDSYEKYYSRPQEHFGSSTVKTKFAIVYTEMELASSDKADDQSLNSIALLLQHITCDPRDKLTWDDWLFYG